MFDRKYRKLWVLKVCEVHATALIILLYAFVATYSKTDPRKAENFDKIFTRVPIRLTPVDTAVLEMNMRGDEFSNFTYYNPYFSELKVIWSNELWLERNRNTKMRPFSINSFGFECVRLDDVKDYSIMSCCSRYTPMCDFLYTDIPAFELLFQTALTQKSSGPSATSPFARHQSRS